MAKSKNGGTRSMIRGRVGSDVYSVGKDAKGKKQQVIRSLAETVANPQTVAQMRGRMIMSTIMQAVSGMAMIIDHSFDNVSAGQPSISEFIAKNYALVKADINNHPAENNIFGLNKFGEKGIKQGAYVVSSGRAAGISGCTIDGTNKTVTIAVGGTLKFSELLEALSIGRNDYFTVVAIDAAKGFVYARLRVSTTIADDDVISAENISSVFTIEGNVAVTPSVSSTNIVLTFATLSANVGIIVSRKAESGYIHNSVTLAAPSAPTYTSDVALPTYPVGSQRFLNGGADSSIVPDSSSDGQGGGGDNTPTTVAAPTIAVTGEGTSRTVTISATSGASIYYTTDGNDPTSASTAYSEALTISESCTVKAIAVKDGVSSTVASETITISDDDDEHPGQGS